MSSHGASSWGARAAPGAIAGAVGLGAISVVAQAIAAREALAVFAGNELVIGLLLAVWYLGIVAGTLATAWLPGRWAPALGPLLLPAAALAMAAGMALLRTSQSWSGVAAGELPGLGRMLLVCLVAVTPQSALIGAAFPTLCQLLAGSSDRPPGLAIGRVYGVEALASLAAGLATSLALLPLLGVERSWWVAALFATAVGAAAALLLRQRVAAGACALCLVCVAASAGSGWLWRAAERTRATRFAAYGPGYQRQSEVDTRYQNLVLASSASRSSFAAAAPALSVFADGHYLMTVPDPFAVAPRVHLALAQHPRPRRALLVGAAMLGALDEIYAHGIEQLDAAELDPALLERIGATLGEPAQTRLRSGALRLIGRDVRRLVRDSDRRYDLVVVDLPPPTTAMVNRAFTVEFFAQVRRLLAAEGALVVMMPSTEAFFGPAAISPPASIWAALGRVFEHRVATPGADGILAAAEAPGVVTADPAVLARRFGDRGVQSSYFAAGDYALRVGCERSAELRAALERAAAPVNSDRRPISYYRNLILFGHYTSPALAVLLRDLERLSAPIGAGVLIALGALAAWLRRRRSRRPRSPALPALLAIFTSGLLGTAESIALLYAFQNCLGVVYNGLAALVGLFMFGLAAGSLALAHLLERRRITAPKALVWSEAGNLALALLLGGALVFAARLGPVAAVLVIAASLVFGGAGVGAAFTAAAAVLRDRVAISAGQIDAADCLGAAVGALATGIVALPLFGAVGTALLLAALKLASLLVVATDRALRPAAGVPPAVKPDAASN
ncbi:MAG: hypothetical protein JXR83_08395 [Deltaproteobacteria bacterium]|nr:hypothetical protein [Deltaproteobacteria bacterium]